MNNLGSIGARFTLDISELQTSLGQAQTAIGQTQQGFNSQLGASGISAGVAGLAVVGGGLLAMVGASVKAVKSADEFKQALNGLSAETGATGTELDGMKNIMTEIYNNNFGDSFKDIATAMAEVKTQSGASGEELKKMTENALTLRDTFGIDVNESVGAVSRMMKDFGISSEEAFNLMAQGAQKGLNQNKDMSDQVREYSTYYSQLGLTGQDMFNMLANGVKSGVYQVDLMNDAVKEFGIRAIDGSKTTTEAFKSLGLDADKTGKAFAKGGADGKKAFEDVNQKLFEIKDPLLQNQLGVALYGTKWEDVGKKGIEALSKTKGSVDKTKDALEQINKVKYDSFGEAITGIGRQFETGLFIPIGDKLLPILNEFAKWFQQKLPEIKELMKKSVEAIGSAFDSVVNSVKNVMEFYKQHEDAIQIVGAGIAGAAGAFTILTVAVGIWTGIGALATGVTTAFGVAVAFATAPVTLIALGIGALIAVGVLLYKNWDEITKFATECWDSIKTKTTEVFESVSKFLIETWDGIKKSVTETVDNIKKSITENWDSIKTKTDEIYNAISKFLSETWGTIKTSVLEIVEAIKTEIHGKYTFLETKTTEIFNAISKFLSETWGTIKTSVVQLVEDLKKGIDQKWTDIKESAKIAWDDFIVKIVEWTGKLKDDCITKFKELLTYFSEIKTDLKQYAKDMFEAFKEGALEIIGNIYTAITGDEKGFGKAITWIKNLKNDALTWGGDFIQGFVDGITAKLSLVIEKARQVARDVASAVKSTLGMESPSKVMKQLGEFTIDGFIMGMANRNQLLSDTMSRMLFVPSFAGAGGNNSFGSSKTTNNNNNSNSMSNNNYSITQNNHLSGSASIDNANKSLVRALQQRGLKHSFI